MELSAKVLSPEYSVEKDHASLKETIVTVGLVLVVCAFTGIMVLGAIAQPELFMSGITSGVYPL